MAYTFNPAKVIDQGLDRMRFELGDVMVEGGADTAALTDEEIQAVLTLHPERWNQAKLMLLESLCRRFSYEVDTRTKELSLSLGERAKLWRSDYEKLKQQISYESMGVPKPSCGKGPHYFYAGMQRNERADGS